MKNIILLSVLLSTTIFANPICINKDIADLSRITAQILETKGSVDKKIVKKGLEKVSHVQAKHNSKLNSKQKAIFEKAEKVLKANR